MSEELRAIDADHFWIGGVMIDLVQLRYQASSITNRRNVSVAQVHDINAALMMLERYALGLSDPTHRYADLVTLPKVIKYLKMANEVGLRTGYVSKEGR